MHLSAGKVVSAALSLNKCRQNTENTGQLAFEKRNHTNKQLSFKHPPKKVKDSENKGYVQAARTLPTPLSYFF